MTRPVVLAGQRLSTSLMEDTGTVTRPVNGGVLDPVSGAWVPSAPTAVYDGPCRVLPVNASEEEAVFGDTTLTTMRVVVLFPHDTPDFRVDDVVTVSGRTFHVVAVVPPSTFSMRRHVGCEVQEP